MTAAVYAPGPSLTPVPADLTIGVNRAAIALPCDVWVASDVKVIREAADAVQGSPLLVTSEVSTLILDAVQATWRGQAWAWEPLEQTLDHTRTNWQRFSILAAMVYAAHVGADEVVVSGADWEGDAEWDGARTGDGRTDERWREERELFEAVCWALPGVRVSRHTCAAQISPGS